MWTLLALIACFIGGAALASIYHTRIDSVVANLRWEKAVLEADINNWKNQATNARFELNDLRRRIEGKVTEIGKKL